MHIGSNGSWSDYGHWAWLCNMHGHRSGSWLPVLGGLFSICLRGEGGRNQFRDEKELSKMQCRAARRRHKKMCFKVRRRHIFVDICSFRLEGGCSSSISGQ